MPDGVSVQPAANRRGAGVDVAPRQIHITDNLDLLLKVLPPTVCAALQQQAALDTLLDVALDLGLRVMPDEFSKRVVVVDTSNEIAGDGDIPHPGIGGARRMQVPHPELQHAVMIEAVENHMPQVIVIDEIGTEAEALAARTIAERGVQLIATAHGNTLDNQLANPTLSPLVGGR